MGQRLGQHFLHDTAVLNAIVACIVQQQQRIDAERVIEIGPGKGALTQLISPLFSHMVAIERDETMRPVLESLLRKHPDATVVRNDVLQVQLDDSNWLVLVDGTPYGESTKTMIVGNLPYYITSPIFRKFFVEKTIFPGGVFLIQREVGEKLASDSTKKSYLRRLVNYRYNVQYAFTVSPSAFRPPPKIDSCVVVFERKSQAALPSSISYERFERFLDAIHGYKRKTLRKIASLEKECFEELGIVLPVSYAMKRVEELGREEMATLLGA